MQEVGRPTVLIVDDHDGFRDLAAAVLSSSGWQVVGAAATGAEALAAQWRVAADVVLLDINLPDRDGFSVARELASGANAPTVVLISSRDWSDVGMKVRQCGAVGFLQKEDLSGAKLLALATGITG
jgi:DNA-binding NarL/FixJ family response regulator